MLKPSELTPLTALRLAEITADILPPGVFNVVTGQGETAGAALVRHPKVAMVSLTGEVATGKVDHAGGGRLAEARAPRARRQGARSSCSTTPTSRRSIAGVRRGRLLQLGPGLHRRDAG